MFIPQAIWLTNLSDKIMVTNHSDPYLLKVVLHFAMMILTIIEGTYDYLYILARATRIYIYIRVARASIYK